MHRIIFLGAGASKDAGYPVMKDLLSKMESLFHNSRIRQESKDWQEFQEYRENSTGPLRTVLDSNNPELIFSFLDLMEICLHEGDAQSFAAVFKKSIERSQNVKNSDWWECPKRDDLVKMESLRTMLQRLLTEFFLQKNYEDKSNPKMHYLENGFKKLKKGDSIITTNWDTLAERTLLNLGKWYPIDGYGFDRDFTVQANLRCTNKQTKILNMRSTIKVLKLHGNVAWHRDSSGEFYLRYDGYLQNLSIPRFDCTLRDKMEPPSGSGPDGDSVAILPSLNKTLDDVVLQQIWHQAFSCIRNAREIVFVGYSLPSADMAVRVFVNEIKEKARKNKIKVIVVNPSKDDMELWKKFFGIGVKFESILENAKEYFLNL